MPSMEDHDTAIHRSLRSEFLRPQLLRRIRGTGGFHEPSPAEVTLPNTAASLWSLRPCATRSIAVRSRLASGWRTLPGSRASDNLPASHRTIRQRPGLPARRERPGGHDAAGRAGGAGVAAHAVAAGLGAVGEEEHGRAPRGAGPVRGVAAAGDERGPPAEAARHRHRQPAGRGPRRAAGQRVERPLPLSARPLPSWLRTPGRSPRPWDTPSVGDPSRSSSS